MEKGTIKHKKRDSLNIDPFLVVMKKNSDNRLVINFRDFTQD
jgi:hypothetical protein